MLAHVPDRWSLVWQLCHHVLRRLALYLLLALVCMLVLGALLLGSIEPIRRTRHTWFWT